LGESVEKHMSGHIILICEDSSIGIFTGIYEAYEKKLDHDTTILQVGEEDNLRLFAEYIRVMPSQEKAEKVIRTIRSRFGEETMRILFEALASTDLQKGHAVYQMIVFGLRGNYSGKLIDCLSFEPIIKVVALSTAVWHECHHFYGFLRFKELTNGILFAQIKPKAQLLELLGEHFSNRFPNENFMIYDEAHDNCLIHGVGKEWFIISGDLLRMEELPEFSTEELQIQELFKHFCHKIAIKERENISLQQQMLPLRYRSNMVEV